MRSDARKRAADHTPGSGERLTEAERTMAALGEHRYRVFDPRAGQRLVGCICGERQPVDADRNAERHNAHVAEAIIAALRRADGDGLRADIEAVIAPTLSNPRPSTSGYSAGRWDAFALVRGALDPDARVTVLARHAAEPGAQEAGQ